jgi:hypothetical protein
VNLHSKHYAESRVNLRSGPYAEKRVKNYVVLFPILGGDWLYMVSLGESLWRGVWICPLIPIVLSTCLGMPARGVSEVATWFRPSAVHVCKQSNGMQVPWSAVVATTEQCSVVDATTIGAMDAYSTVCTMSRSQPDFLRHRD